MIGVLQEHYVVTPYGLDITGTLGRHATGSEYYKNITLLRRMGC